MASEQITEGVGCIECMKEVALFLFHLFPEVEDLLELRSRIAHLPLVYGFEEHHDLPHRLLRVFIALHRDPVLFLGP